MTPSNTPITPEIENIADNQGNKHTVIPSNHTHAQSEVLGLENFINTRSHKIDKSQGNTYAYVNAQSDANTGQAKIVVGIENLEEIEYSRTIDVTWANIKNMERALLDPDTTPTASSDKLVTSGGVKAALEGKANKVDVMYSVFEKSDENENIELDNVFSDGHETSHFVLINRMGEQIKVSDFFYTQYGELVENGHTLSDDSTAIVKIIHYNDGSTHKFFMVVEEIYEA